MKQLCITAEALAKDINSLVVRMRGNRTSLATLAADAGTLAYQFASLRVDIIRIYEKRQRNAINPDSSAG